jgi:hypothetical protein
MIVVLSALWAIELGDFQLKSFSSLGELVWFVLGLFVLSGVTYVFLRWNNRRRPDPFA